MQGNLACLTFDPAIQRRRRNTVKDINAQRDVSPLTQKDGLEYGFPFDFQYIVFLPLNLERIHISLKQSKLHHNLMYV